MLSLMAESTDSTDSIIPLKWDDTTGPWTFYYKEWCPFTQQIFKMLNRAGAFEGFVKRVGTKNMKCFSDFEDVIADQLQNSIDPTHIPCDRFFSQGRKEQEGVFKEM